METRLFQSGNLSFEYLDSWEVEKANTSNNPDCIATLFKFSNFSNTYQFGGV